MTQTRPHGLTANGATPHNGAAQANTPLAAPYGDIANHPGIALILSALEKLRFGAINITVHEGRLVQVDVTERSRFQP